MFTDPNIIGISRQDGPARRCRSEAIHYDSDVPFVFLFLFLFPLAFSFFVQSSGRTAQVHSNREGTIWTS